MREEGDFQTLVTLFIMTTFFILSWYVGFQWGEDQGYSTGYNTGKVDAARVVHAHITNAFDDAIDHEKTIFLSPVTMANHSFISDCLIFTVDAPSIMFEGEMLHVNIRNNYFTSIFDENAGYIPVVIENSVFSSEIRGHPTQ